MIAVHDDWKRALTFTRAPQRIVSLVPSDTFTLAALGGVERIVGRTDYCEEPRGAIEAVASVGGTKDARVDAIVALRPDVVIANQEENTRATLDALHALGIPLFIVFPKRVADGVSLVARYAKLLGVEHAPHTRAMLKEAYAGLREVEALRSKATPLRAFCPIWADPLMTIHGDTFMSDALDLCGAQNVFADRERRYPLAADLGKRAPLPVEKIVGRDTRYPRITHQELVDRAPEIVLLPDEPHPFSEAEADAFRALDLPARSRVVRLPGKDLCWYGAWSFHGDAGIPRLRRVIDALR